jgi:tetratricopeptide (TPR) repeat protein
MKPARIWLFRLIAVLLPLAMFVLAELFLRLIHFGSDLPVFIPSALKHGYLHLNPEVSKRYFVKEENATKGYEEEFSAVKTKGIFRIFVQGESSAVGFPYLFNGSFHRMLKYRLEREFPEIHFEIINLGLTAVSSYTLADFGQEIIRQKPDAILIYAGHNEYVGALGVGSTSRLGNNPFMVRVGIQIRRLRLTQLFLGLVHKLEKENAGQYSETLMQRMARKQGIPYGSKKYQQGIDQFNYNMSRLLSQYQRNHIPVFMADLISNEKDMKPFMSIAANPANQKKFDDLIRQGENHMTNGCPDSAAKIASAIVEEDSLYAAAYYLLGNVYYSKGKSDSAALMFRKALDHDQLRFRAPSAVNEHIYELAQQYGAVVVPFHQTASKFCRQGIIGSEIVTEHVHPNLKGYSMLADLFHNELVNSKLLPDQHESFPDEAFYSEMPLLRMDTLIGLFNIIRLKKGWPFYQDESAIPEGQNNDLQQRMALGVVTGTTNWTNAMDTLYRDAVRRQNHDLALRIAESLYLQFPYDPRFAEKAGGHALSLGNYKKAGFYFAKAFEILPSPELAQQAFVSFLKDDMPEKALPYISYLMRESTGSNSYIAMRSMVENIIQLKAEYRMSPDNNEICMGIAGEYFRMGNFFIADKYLRQILSRNSSYTLAREMQKKIAELQH